MAVHYNSQVEKIRLNNLEWRKCLYRWAFECGVNCESLYGSCSTAQRLWHVCRKSGDYIDGNSDDVNRLQTRNDGVCNRIVLIDEVEVPNSVTCCRVPVISASVFDGLSSISFSRCHLVVTASAPSEIWRSHDRSMDVYNCVTSAYWWHKTLNEEIRLLADVKMENRIDPRTEPCWTLVVKLTVDERQFPMET